MPILDPSRLQDRTSSDEILDAFLTFLEETGTTPYDHQEEAILELFAGHNVILNTPTGSGKSLVALALQFRAICQNRRSYYTVPIKALANEKFLSLCNTFGPENVGMITGDATVNPTAPVICCTAEILANLALRDGAAAPVDDVIMDEFHYYSDHERGVSWQIPLLTLPRARFLLMSATIGDTGFFSETITELTGVPTTLVKSENRPVPLEFDFSTIALEEKIEELVTQDRAPVYLVHFSQLACAKTAQDLMSRNFCSKEEKQQIADLLIDADFRSPYGKEIKKLLRHGLGIHHAGLLPKYRTLVEKLAQKGLLKVICGTDTLGVGVNVPIRTVVFTQLFKYGGQSTKTLAVRDFKQIAGRAGRRGFDNVGYVVAQAPPHVIDNIKAEAKAAAKGGKSKAMKKKAPERGFVMWDENTFRKLIDSPSEKLSSSFVMRHGMLLNVLSRKDEDGCEALRKIIRNSHETPAKKAALRKRAFELFRGLVEGNILKIIPVNERTTPAKIALNIDLQDDFSLNQALGLYLVETIPQLDPEDPAYPLNVISLAEAIAEDPAQIIRKQVDKLNDKLVAQMKADGIEYDDRMEALEQVEHPKPGKEFIYTTYNEFVLSHPWAKEAGVKPKSIAREMFEEYTSFEDYIKTYGLEKSEAILLRHLSEIYKILAQTVPENLKTEELLEAEMFFKDMLQATDSSLIDEWEKMRNPDAELADKKPAPPRQPSQREIQATRLKSTRTLIFEFLKHLSQYRYEQAFALVESDLTPPQLAELMDTFHETNGTLRLDPEARNKKHTHIEKLTDQNIWKIHQTLIDEEQLNDHTASFTLKTDGESTQPSLHLDSIAPI
ncbi:DEAD/DEAH box helicase [Luteolibacter sp. AS25]|uniref:DEAD/DEAH box helicase n=1 Tax=Luteolibacter sp. AS25 TaxID=3135776 RepID=UPI00398AFB14